MKVTVKKIHVAFTPDELGIVIRSLCNDDRTSYTELQNIIKSLSKYYWRTGEDS